MRFVPSVLLGGLVLLVAPSFAVAGGEPGAITAVGSSVLGVAPNGASGGTVAVGLTGSASVLVKRFASSGKSGAKVSAGAGIGRAVVVQPDGRIVVVGSVDPSAGPSDKSNGFVRRFNVDGSRDRGFAAPTLKNVRPNAVALGPKGTIVVAGSTPGNDGFSRVALTRLTASGRRDSSFSSDGSAVIDLAPGSEARGVAVRSDGRIVIAGQQRPGLQITNALIARVRSSGTLDPSFNGGKPYFYFHPQGGGNSSLNALALDRKGRMVAAGIDVRDTGNFALFVRLTASGTPDPGFGEAGVQSTPASRNYSGGAQIGPRALTFAGSGRIAVAGAFQDSGLRTAALWVLTSDGQLDASVGAGGFVMTQPGGPDGGGEAFGLATARDGTLMVGGVATAPPAEPKGYVQRFAGPGGPTAAPVPSGGTGTPGLPRFGRVTLSERTFRPATRSILSFKLTSPGMVSVRLRERRTGRKSGGRCVRTAKRVVPGRRCAVYVSLPGRLLLTAKAGTNRVRVTRSFGGRTLRSGSYRFRLRATGGAFRNIGFRVRARR